VAAKRPAPLTQLRFQLVIGLALCVALPAMLRFGFVVDPILFGSANNAVFGGAGAYVIALFLNRQLGSIPGVHGGSHILLSVVLPFSAMAVVFLMLRLEYSRYIFIASFVHTIAWLLALHSMTRSPPDIAVVPGGHADQLPGVRGANWRCLNQPPGTLAGLRLVAADLRYDHSGAWGHFLAQCSLAGIPVYHSKKISESLTGKVQIEHLSENSFGSLLPDRNYAKLKVLLDWLFALMLSPLFLLLSLFIAPVIILTSGRPVFYTQERIGYRGAVIRIFKFRTMHHATVKPCPDASDRRDAAITRESDARITRVGAFLRKYRLDELPQIINILRGEMSWIGPRPEAVALARWYESELAFYPYRHVVRPGISGWAQVNQGHVVGPRAVLDKLHYDFFYIKYLSPWLDLIIILRTFRTILGGIGAR
jgi:lipopolysaccharide/colanic/teichoic acid biosynthesis glycosyltransferase